MIKKLKATCDRILARLPLVEGDGNIIGGIIIPTNVRLSDKKPIVELVIESAGPDCKVARAGMKVLVNKNVCAPIEHDGVEWMVFSEVTAIAIIEEVEEVARAPKTAESRGLTIEEIKQSLGMSAAPKNDSDSLPAATS